MLTYFAHEGHDHATEAARSNGSVADAWPVFVVVALIVATVLVLGKRKGASSNPKPKSKAK